MGVVNCYIKYRPSEGGDWSVIYDFSNITIRRQMEAKTNVAKITLPNKFGKYSGKYSSVFKGFKEEDEIYIYGSWGAVVESNNLIMATTVKELNFKSSGKARQIELTCMDRTYQLLNKIYMGGGVDYADGQTAPQVIKKIVDWVSAKEQQNDGRKHSIGTDTYISTTPSAVGGTAFVAVSIALNLKTAYEWIMELSGDPHTRYDSTYKMDRNFIFWIDKDNEFHWVYPSQTPSATLTLNNINIFDVNLKKTIFDVVNMVIFNCGEDPAGVGILWYFYDKTSKQPELRAKYQPMTDIARDLQKLNKDKATAAGTPFTGEYPTSYPFVTTWGLSVANNAAYLGSVGTGDLSNGSGFRNQAVKIGIARSLSITAGTADLRWKGTVAMRGNVDYGVADYLTVNYDDANMVNVNLRCVGLTHQITKNGWSTTLDLEQDAKALAW